MYPESSDCKLIVRSLFHRFILVSHSIRPWLVETNTLAMEVTATDISKLKASFNTAVDNFNYIRFTQAFESTYDESSIRLNLCQLKFARWGYSIGLTDSENDHESLAARCSRDDIKSAIDMLSEVWSLVFHEGASSRKRLWRRPQDGVILDAAASKSVPLRTVAEALRSRSLDRIDSVGLIKNRDLLLLGQGQLTGIIKTVTELSEKLLGLFSCAGKVYEGLCEDDARIVASILIDTEEIDLLSKLCEETDTTLCQAFSRLD